MVKSQWAPLLVLITISVAHRTRLFNKNSQLFLYGLTQMPNRSVASDKTKKLLEVTE